MLHILKLYQKYKSTLNLNIHVTINFNSCHQYTLSSFFFKIIVVTISNNVKVGCLTTYSTIIIMCCNLFG